MIKIALIKDDGTWEEKKLRARRSPFGDDRFQAISYLIDKKFIIDGEFPKGIIEIAVIPNDWKRSKKLSDKNT